MFAWRLLASKGRAVALASSANTWLRAAAAGIHAFLHVPDPLAVPRTLLADFCAFAAGVLVVRRADQHKVGARSADFHARHHELEVGGFDVLAAYLKAMVHRRAEAGRI